MFTLSEKKFIDRRWHLVFVAVVVVHRDLVEDEVRPALFFILKLFEAIQNHKH